MAVDRNKKEKVYVRVNSDFDITGYMQPRSVTWGDGRTFKIDKIKDFRPANIYRDDWSGYCFTVMIRGEEKHLFFGNRQIPPHFPNSICYDKIRFINQQRSDSK